MKTVTIQKCMNLLDTARKSCTPGPGEEGYKYNVLKYLRVFNKSLKIIAESLLSSGSWSP